MKRLTRSSLDCMGLSYTILGDEWRTWHMDDPELESGEKDDEGVKKKKRGCKWRRRAVTSRRILLMVDGSCRGGG